MKRGRGNPDLDRDRNTNTDAANLTRTELADTFAADQLAVLYEVIARLGIKKWAARARWLNAHGHRTRLGNEWTGRTLKQFYERVKDRTITPTPGSRYVYDDDDMPG